MSYSVGTVLYKTIMTYSVDPLGEIMLFNEYNLLHSFPGYCNCKCTCIMCLQKVVYTDLQCNVNGNLCLVL